MKKVNGSLYDKHVLHFLKSKINIHLKVKLYIQYNCLTVVLPGQLPPVETDVGVALHHFKLYFHK